MTVYKKGASLLFDQRVATVVSVFDKVSENNKNKINCTLTTIDWKADRISNHDLLQRVVKTEAAFLCNFNVTSYVAF